VSLALSPTTDTSLLSGLPVVVDALRDESHPALALCRLTVGSDPRSGGAWGSNLAVSQE